MAESKNGKLTLSELLETDFLKCKKCGQHFACPVLLPCLHAFCSGCIATLPQTDVPDSNPTLTRLHCPLCHTEVTVDKTLSATPFLLSLCQLYSFKHHSQRTCSYCKYDKKTESAVSLCLDCADDLCESCTTAHRKTRITRQHVVAPYAQINKGLYDHDIRVCHEPPCLKHSAKFQNFCPDCSQLICQTCLSESHKGHTLETLDEAMARMKPEASRFLKGLWQQIPELSKHQTFLTSQMSSLQDKKKSLSESINKQAGNIHALINAQRDAMLAELNSLVEKETELIQRHSQDLATTKQSLENNAEFLDYLLTIGLPVEVLQLHDMVMQHFKQLVHKKPPLLSNHVEPSFLPGPANQQNVSIMFGSVTNTDHKTNDQNKAVPEAKLSLPTLLPSILDPPQLLSSLNAKQPDDGKEVWPSGLSINRNMMVIVDRDNKKIKVFDCSTVPCKLKFSFGGKGENALVSPFDAVLQKNGVIAVTDTGAEKVKIFDVAGRWIGNLAGEFRHPRGISATGCGKLVVVDGLLLRLTIHEAETGKVERIITTTKDKSGNKVLVDPFYVTVTDAGNIIVTDHAAPNIKVFDLEGQHLITYGTYGTNPGEMLKPYGVCTDRYGQILLADSDNHRIHLLQPHGKFSKFLLTHHNKLSHPITLAINAEGHLVVGEAFGKVKTFKYL